MELPVKADALLIISALSSLARWRFGKAKGKFISHLHLIVESDNPNSGHVSSLNPPVMFLRGCLRLEQRYGRLVRLSSLWLRIGFRRVAKIVS
jgi:hypothetical protein